MAPVTAILQVLTHHPSN